MMSQQRSLQTLLYTVLTGKKKITSNYDFDYGLLHYSDFLLFAVGLREGGIEFIL